MVFATMFIACADNIVCPSPEYTQPIQDTTAVQDTVFNPVYDTTDTPVQDSTDTNSVTPVTTLETPVYYNVIIGGVCIDMNFQSTGTLTDDTEVRTFVGTWQDRCVITATEPVSYIKDNYTLNQIVTILMDNLSFDSNLVNSLLTQVNSGSIVYIYNTNSGLNFLYIRRLDDK